MFHHFQSNISRLSHASLTLVPLKLVFTCHFDNGGQSHYNSPIVDLIGFFSSSLSLSSDDLIRAN